MLGAGGVPYLVIGEVGYVGAGAWRQRGDKAWRETTAQSGISSRVGLTDAEKEFGMGLSMEVGLFPASSRVEAGRKSLDMSDPPTKRQSPTWDLS